MSSDYSIICGLPDPPWEAAGRDLPPAPQTRAVRKILSRCQWRDTCPNRLVASVAWPLATVVAKRTPRGMRAIKACSGHCAGLSMSHAMAACVSSCI